MCLQDIGFQQAGEWRLAHTVTGVTFELSQFRDDRVVYAFVVNRNTKKPKYIGICEKDTTTLRDRMGRYRSAAGGSTNQRIAKEIKRCLKTRKRVLVFALKPRSGLTYRNIPIDLVKGLENGLIQKFRPTWNIAGNE